MFRLLLTVFAAFDVPLAAFFAARNAIPLNCGKCPSKCTKIDNSDPSTTRHRPTRGCLRCSSRSPQTSTRGARGSNHDPWDRSACHRQIPSTAAATQHAQSRAEQTSSLLLVGCRDSLALTRGSPRRELLTGWVTWVSRAHLEMCPSSSIKERFALQPDSCALLIFQECSILQGPLVILNPGSPGPCRGHITHAPVSVFPLALYTRETKAHEAILNGHIVGHSKSIIGNFLALCRR